MVRSLLVVLGLSCFAWLPGCLPAAKGNRPSWLQASVAQEPSPNATAPSTNAAARALVPIRADNEAMLAESEYNLMTARRVLAELRKRELPDELRQEVISLAREGKLLAKENRHARQGQQDPEIACILTRRFLARVQVHQGYVRDYPKRKS